MLAHIHIMKTAGQTVCDILRNTFTADHCDLRVGDLATADDLRFARRFYPDLKSIAGHSVRPRGTLAEIADIRFFVFLRDPVSRCLSHYQFERVRNGSSVDFLPWLEQNRDYQTKILCGSRDADQAIEVIQDRIGFVGLVEQFDLSLQMLRNWSGYDLIFQDYRSRNIAGDASIKTQIASNPEYMRALAETNTEDQRLYQYVQETIFPRQQHKFTDRNPRLLHYPTAPTDIAWGVIKRNFLYKPVAKMWARRHRAA